MQRAPTFADLGVCKEICDIITNIGWTRPTEIQIKALPIAFAGKDIVGLAETGSGKTAAFAIPIIQNLLLKPKHNYALILAPTRELSLQIKSQLLDLGNDFGLKVICLVGGQPAEEQLKEIKKSKFHIIVGTPGRIVYFLKSAKEFKIDRIKYFVLDEADRMLGESFDAELEIILPQLPSNRHTFMYSATMSEKVEKLQRVCIKIPERLEISRKYSKVDKLDHAFTFLPDQERDFYLLYLLGGTDRKTTGRCRCIVFVETGRESLRLTSMLNELRQHNLIDSKAVALNGLMSQDNRQIALTQFRSGQTAILVATDLAARGLDIADVDLVINFDVPTGITWSEALKSYIHRVGRTARAGRPGRAISLVTPYSVTRLKAIESALGHRIPQLRWPGSSCLDHRLRDLVLGANKQAKANLRETDKKLVAKRKKHNKEERNKTGLHALNKRIRAEGTVRRGSDDDNVLSVSSDGE